MFELIQIFKIIEKHHEPVVLDAMKHIYENKCENTFFELVDNLDNIYGIELTVHQMGRMQDMILKNKYLAAHAVATLK